MANPTLLWFAGYSNASSVAIVSICFILMTIFIALVSMNSEFSNRNPSAAMVEQRNMVKVVNPFFLQLDQQASSLKDGIKIHLSRLCACQCVILWGVEIEALHKLILTPGHEIRRSLCGDDQLGTEHELHPLHVDNVQFTDTGDDVVSVPCPQIVSGPALGSVPRKRYPAVMFVFVPDSGQHCSLEDDDSECSNNIVCSVSIIHLRDEVVTQPSHLIGQYIKTAGVPIYSLQPLYVTSPSERQSHSSSTVSSPTQSASTSDGSDDALQGQSDTDAASPQSSSTGESSHFTGDSSFQAVRKRKQHLSMREGLGDKGDSALCEDSQHFTSSDTGRDPPTGSDADREPSDMCESREFQTKAECVVCQSRKVACAILPCRHACVCLGCFKLLDRCPMCRSALESYFLLSGSADNADVDEDDDDVISEMEQRAVNTNFAQMWTRMNLRLNEFLGFR